MHTEGHDMGRDAADNSTPGDQFNSESPGYETTDVNVSGVAVFLAGLFGFVIMFFFVCYGMGILINNYWEKEDGAPTKWKVEAGAPLPGKGANLASNTQMQQQELQRMTDNFPSPRLDIDDGEQSTADLHAREDLLLDHYSSADGQTGAIRIPIDRAMELIVQRGLPVARQGSAPAPLLMMTGVTQPSVQAPLTTGFARTGFELTVMEARAQKMDYGKAEANAEHPPAK